ADVLIEDYAEKLNIKAQKEIKKARKRFGEAFNEEEFVNTNPRVVKYLSKKEEVLKRMGKSLANEDLEDVKNLIVELEIACPLSGSKNWTDVKQFNLMFGTKLGASADSAMDLYLRPETAQGIFVNFMNIQRSSRLKVPFGIGQIGKSFRNEVTPGNFIFRTREFEQMELEYFVKPGNDDEAYKYYINKSVSFVEKLGIKKDSFKLREHDKDELAHYSKGTTDIEFKFPFGWGELLGISNRTDFDLKAHAEYSGEKLEYRDPITNEIYTPYVIEPSMGMDRLSLATLSDAYEIEQLENDQRVVMRLDKNIAPYKFAILPLSKKHHSESAKNVFNNLVDKGLSVVYDEAGSIGKRYRRQDSIGTPYIITVIDETKSESKVTIRHRDSMKQEEITLDCLHRYI
ncbi:MAG: glycine--tRNA ligase, partial [Mycoplasmataceae bacterium]|nr:glycine--tRNA ligase [Mycoplasmataceae bacterium]